MTLSPDQVRLHAETLMRRREWALAAAAFGSLPPESRDFASGLKHNLSRNLASLQAHRPAVYELLLGLPTQQRFVIAPTPSGRPTVHCRRIDGSVVSLAAGPDPLAGAAAALPKLYQQTPSGEAIALCGVGDGYLTQLLAQRPPTLFMDKQQPVYLIEPEPQILLQCLMIHDFTGAAGSIEQSRFRWFVGGDWHTALEGELFDDPFLPCASVTVGQGLETKSIQAALAEIVQRLLNRDASLADEVARSYADVAPADLARVFKLDAERPPRVLLLTTRLSTVLQFSTRDTAAAFERMGWEARVVIEPTPHHRVLRSAIACTLAEFKPDLVFQIDHLRQEHQGLFPPTLPFVCWVQDHLPHLATPEVGRRIGELDFVLTDATATYVDKFEYPGRQCIPLPKLVVKREIIDPACGSDGAADDMVFVSNASGTPEAMMADGLRLHARNAPTEELIRYCCRSMTAIYERGDALPTYGEVCALLRRALEELGLSLGSDGFDILARWLTHPFNDAMYRQQALGWAADVAREHGLTLALYGKGWDANPRFAPFARGAVGYGDPLSRLTRRSRINLQIVPYLCLHQRLLDGLMAGGFFLIRTHPADVAPAELLRYLDANAATNAGAQPDAKLSELIERSRACLCTTGREDVVEMVRAWEEAGQLTVADGPLPMLGEVGFSDAQGLADRVLKYFRNNGLREGVVATQRRSVGARLSYDAGIRRVIDRIAKLLEETAGLRASTTASVRADRIAA